MKRLFILTCSPFPYGDASSNYIRNFALSVKRQGWEIIVIGRGKNRETDFSNGSYKYQGIQYENVDISKAGPRNFLNLYFRYRVYLDPLERKFSICPNDYIYIYSDFLDIARYARKKVPIGHISYSSVEWFQPFQYKHGSLDPMYLLWKYSFFYRTKKLNKVFPISRELESHYQRFGCRTCLLPVLIDSEDEKSSEFSVRHEGLTNFIYSGIGLHNDSLRCMIGAMYRMPEDLLGQMRLHFTILEETVLIEELGEKAYQLDKIRKSLIFHGWLEYEDLLQLYRCMDFILISREKNKVTVSNFPSKLPELMNFGVVPVCSDVGDYAQLYLTDKKDSIFFEGADERKCCAAMEEAINLPADSLLVMKKNAKNSVNTHLGYHNWSNIIEDFLVL